MPIGLPEFVENPEPDCPVIDKAIAFGENVEPPIFADCVKLVEVSVNFSSNQLIRTVNIN